jgi:hypothetical protein
MGYFMGQREIVGEWPRNDEVSVRVRIATRIHGVNNLESKTLTKMQVCVNHAASEDTDSK